jgi:hypothetical protein
MEAERRIKPQKKPNQNRLRTVTIGKVRTP